MKIRLLKDVISYRLDLRKGKIVSTIETPTNYLSQTNYGEVWVGGKTEGMMKLFPHEYQIVKE
jgi:hypothetical protein